MYLRYIHKLHDLHLSAENFLEAGFTMKLYADMLQWSTRHLPVRVQSLLGVLLLFFFLNYRPIITILLTSNGRGKKNFICKLLNISTGERLGRWASRFVRNWRISMKPKFSTIKSCPIAFWRRLNFMIIFWYSCDRRLNIFALASTGWVFHFLSG